jgi:trk system potassium uptake protein TrkH
MVVAGVNFALFWHVLKGEFSVMLKNPEFRTYAGAIAVITAVLAFLLYRGAAPALGELGGTTEGVTENAIRQAAFQIGSLLNSTGFATANFAEWDTHGKMILLFAMFIGGSAGSTGGGIKVVRWLVTIKALRRELYTTARPDVVQPVKLGGSVVDEDAVRGILVFTVLYFVLLGVSAVFLSLDAARVGFDISTLEAFSAALATIGNIGPGFGAVGPFGSYLEFSPISKLWMTFLMWIGRLEIVPVLALLVITVEDNSS